MKITRRRVTTVSEVTAQMDELAREAAVVEHCYAESAADHMSDFDALRWRTLYAQRCALLARETDVRVNTLASVRMIYGSTSRRPSMLENTVGGLNKLAA